MEIYKDNGQLTPAADLHLKAEERWLEKKWRLPTLQFEEKALRHIHEIEVYQIELMMQNDELRQARHDAETALGEYRDPYDFASVAYFTLDRIGGILSVNRSGANLVGIERSLLLGEYLGLHITDDTRQLFSDFIEKIFVRPGKDSCEVSFIKVGNDLLFVQIVPVGNAKVTECCIAVIDITERKRAEMALTEIRLELQELNISQELCVAPKEVGARPQNKLKYGDLEEHSQWLADLVNTHPPINSAVNSIFLVH